MSGSVAYTFQGNQPYLHVTDFDRIQAIYA